MMMVMMVMKELLWTVPWALTFWLQSCYYFFFRLDFRYFGFVFSLFLCFQLTLRTHRGDKRHNWTGLWSIHLRHAYLSSMLSMSLAFVIMIRIMSEALCTATLNNEDESISRSFASECFCTPPHEHFLDGWFHRPFLANTNDERTQRTLLTVLPCRFHLFLSLFWFLFLFLFLSSSSPLR